MPKISATGPDVARLSIKMRRKTNALLTMSVGLGSSLGLVGLAEAQEYWQFGKPMRMYGVYRRRYENPNVLFSSGNGEQYSKTAIEFNRNSKNSYWEEASANFEVITDKISLDGEECTRYASRYDDLPIREDDLKKMKAEDRYTLLMALSHRTVEAIVAPNGQLKMVHSDHRDGNGRVQIWAKINKDDITVTIENKNGQKKLTITPALGVEAFTNPIAALAKIGDKDREPHKFCAVDYRTGGIIDYTVTYRTKFSGKIDQTKYTGSVYELAFNKQKRFLYVSEAGELLQVDFGNDRDFINAVMTTDIGKV